MEKRGIGQNAELPSFVRRLGSSPEQRGSGSNVGSCPDLFELSTGDFAVISVEAPEGLRDLLPPDAGIAPNERLTILPRAVLLAAKADIPDA